MPDEIVKRILDLLGGFDLYVGIGALLVGTLFWFFVGAKKQSKRNISVN
jgi:hypothetical protein